MAHSKISLQNVNCFLFYRETKCRKALKSFFAAVMRSDIRGENMTHTLKVSYDDRDFLEIWNPKFDFGPKVSRVAGLYNTPLNCAKAKGAKRAFDSLMSDAFSQCYQDVHKPDEPEPKGLKKLPNG
jgi:hypothetical protein